MNKRMLQLLFTILMMVVMLPMNVLAGVEDGSGVQQSKVASVTIGDEMTTYTSLETAVSALEDATEQDNAVLKLLDDVDLGDDGLMIKSGVFTFDLNGYSINSDAYTLDVRNEGNWNITKLVIRDSSTKQNGKIMTREGSCAALLLSVEVTLESGTIISAGSAVDIMDGGHFIMKGGIVKTPGNRSAIFVSDGILTVQHGQISSTEYELLVYNGRVDMSSYEAAEGISIHFDADAVLDAFQLPEGYTLIDEIGNSASALKRGNEYTIGIAPDITYYPVWIGDEQVTEKKTSGEGWKYDIDTNTLTLENYSYSGKGHAFADGESASAVYAVADTLTILLEGENKIVHQLDEDSIADSSIGIYVEGEFINETYTGGNLHIKGTGTLELECADFDIEEKSRVRGIYASDIKIENCKIVTKAGKARNNTGISAMGVAIENADVKIQCEEAFKESIGISAWSWNDDYTDILFQDINVVNSTVTIISGAVADGGKSSALYGNLKVSGYSNGYEWKVRETDDFTDAELVYNEEDYFAVREYKEPSYMETFVDVPADAYYAEAVAWAVKNNIAYGITPTTFAPNASCTRAEAVTFLWRCAGSSDPKSSDMSFKDVKEGDYYYKAVLWAVENGIAYGNTSDSFAPNEICTRAHVMSFLWRYQKSPEVSVENPFVDVAADAYYNAAVLWAVKEGITYGTTSTTYSPDNNCTRAEIVTFLFRCLSDK